MDKLNNTPYGSTHYLQNGDQTNYYKVSENSVCFYASSGKWIETEIQAQNLPNCIIEIPKQQADDDLTWLARNVHEWPCGKHQPWCYVVTKIDGERTWASNVLSSSFPYSQFDKDQWLTRRAELQNKPDWGEVESDAEWVAQRHDGRWEFFNREPFASSGDVGGWRFDGVYAWLSQNSGEVLGDWRDTLERRPQAAKSEPDPEPSSDDWHNRGELPPVGTECEMFLDGNWEWVFIVGFSRHGHPVTENEFGAMCECVNCKFRPVQTERERVASELVDVMLAVPVGDRKTPSESFMSMALAIYDHLHPESKS
jgi:hypothetical protein